MGLFNFLKQRAALKQLTSTPYREAVATAINKKLVDTKLRDHWSAEAVERMAAWLWQTAVEIEASPNPVAACREALVDQTIARANWATLLFEADDDPTGFVGTQGVTGQLHAHIHEIARRDEEFRNLFDCAPEDIDFQSAHDVAVVMMWKHYWTSEVFNTCRVGLGDYVEGGENWYNTLFHAMCVFQEYQCRQLLGWSNAVDGDHMNIIPLAYNSMMDFALSDAPFPARAWRNHYADWIAEGRLRPPFGTD